jgi:urate oxidase
MSGDNQYAISYGKASVPVYRVYAQPLRGVRLVPESSFTGRENTLFAAEVDVEVFGDNFLPAYTQGDNRNVVATDSMKNFILRYALDYAGATLEGFLDLLGRSFLSTYPIMERLRLTGRELPFTTVDVPAAGGTFAASGVLFSHARGDYTSAVLEFARAADGTATLTSHRCGRVGMQLFKVTGSSFTRFVRDDYTTLPERGDRPLYVFMDLNWRYIDASDLVGDNISRYVPAEQVRDVATTVFAEFVSESIQHLVNEMGSRILDRFPQLAEISFAAQNRTRDPVGASETDSHVKVYSDPFSAFGLINLTMSREGTH